MTYQQAFETLSEKEKQIYIDYNSVHFAYCDMSHILSDILYLDSDYQKLIDASEEFADKLSTATTKKARAELLEDYMSTVRMNEKYNTFHRANQLGQTEKKLKEHEQKLKKARDNMNEEYAAICQKLHNVTD